MQVNQKVLDWAKANPQYSDYVDNYPLIAALYAENNTAKSVEDAIDSGKAELTLIVISEYDEKPKKFCRNCKRMKCTCQGEPDFEELKGHTYRAGDKTGILKAKFAPWYKGESFPEKNKTYVFTGVIRDDPKYGKEISVSSFRPVTVSEATAATTAGNAPTPNNVGTDSALHKAIEYAKNYFNLRDGISNAEKFKEKMTKEGFGSLVDAVIKQLEITSEHTPNGQVLVYKTA